VLMHGWHGPLGTARSGPVLRPRRYAGPDEVVTMEQRDRSGHRPLDFAWPRPVRPALGLV